MVKQRLIQSLVLLITGLFLIFVNPSSVFAVGGYTWANRTTGTSMSGQSWDGIASSASGKYVAAVEWGGDIFTSSNYGASWTNVTTGTALHGLDWDQIAASASGQYLSATADNNDIYTSSNYGASWTNVTTGTALHGLDWAAIDASWSGQYLLAAIGGGGGGVYTSSNYGASWTIQPSAGTGNFYEVGVSSTGQYMYIANTSGTIRISSDYGVTWTDITAGSSNWGAIDTSASGQYVVAGTLGGDIYTSNDFGHTWTDRQSAGSHTWENVQMSYTGQYMVGVSDGGIFESSDYGVTWTNITTDPSFSGLNWYNAAMSASGQYIHASIYGGAGDIYTFTNSALAPTTPGIGAKTVTVTANNSMIVDVLSGISGFPDASTLQIVSAPSHGTAVDPPNTITYTPANGYLGQDALTYQVCSLFDPSVCSQAILSFNVIAAPDTGFGQPTKTFGLNQRDVIIVSALSFGLGLLILRRQKLIS